MSAVADLEQALHAMASIKPPGVTASKINAITSLCVANVQSESVLIQKIYTHFKKTAATHKLGVLYVVDSVTRQWLDHAKKNGQTVSPSATAGTFAAGVNRVTELLPSLMQDIIQNAPADQKEKIKKLVDIWERGSTFPSSMLAGFKEKLNAPISQMSTTPDGTPPPPPGTAPPPPANPSAILAALASMAKQNNAAPVANNIPALQNAASQAVNQAPYQTSGVGAPPNVMAGLFGMNQAPTNGAPANPLAALQSLIPQNPAPAPVPTPVAAPPQDALQQQLALIQILVQNGVPQDQWAGIIAAMNAQNASNPSQSLQQPWNQNGSWDSQNKDASRDQARGYRRSRSRSRSPPGWNRGRNSPRRDGSFDTYGGGSPRGRDRRRSPLGRRERSRSPPMPKVEKWIEYDPSLGHDKIKVLSRTLFVGGVSDRISESELKDMFARFGIVQTSIVNHDKRHAFIKMLTRKDAARAKEGMDGPGSPDPSIRTRWGVGYGPRDCSDYQTGVSIIPIGRLTEADKKWMLTAEYGGSGGKPIVGGLCVEEPDIEIGQGVSSKAISRRMVTDQSGATGPRSTRNEQRHRDNPNFQPRGSGRDDKDTHHNNNANTDTPPAVPGFNFALPGFPGGLPMFNQQSFMYPSNGSQGGSGSGNTNGR